MAHAVFAEAVAKGTRMFNLLTTSTVSKRGTTIPEQSAFTNYDDLARYGYHESSAPEPFTLKPLRECLVSLHVDHTLSTKEGHNTRIYHEHTKDVTIDGIRYRATDAYFSQIVNRDEGVLIALDNITAPHMAIVCDPIVTTFAPLRHWSDIAYLQTLAPSVASNATANASAPIPSPNFNLRFVIRYCCQNMVTSSVVQHILSSCGGEAIPEWPGISFPIEPECEEGLALLGTPNGASVGWLLAQHREQFRGKRVTKVALFYAPHKRDVARYPSLAFWVDGAEDAIEKGMKSETDIKEGSGGDNEAPS